MSEAILTHYVGPTNTRGSRVIAETGEKDAYTGKRDRVSVNWKDRLVPIKNHYEAAMKLKDKMGWEWNTVCVTWDEKHYIWCDCLEYEGYIRGL